MVMGARAALPRWVRMRWRRRRPVAAIVGVAAAVAVKLLLAPSQVEPSASVAAERHRLMREAATDPLYLADQAEVNDDFAFTDAENI